MSKKPKYIVITEHDNNYTFATAKELSAHLLGISTYSSGKVKVHRIGEAIEFVTHPATLELKD